MQFKRFADDDVKRSTIRKLWYRISYSDDLQTYAYQKYVLDTCCKKKKKEKKSFENRTFLFWVSTSSSIYPQKDIRRPGQSKTISNDQELDKSTFPYESANRITFCHYWCWFLHHHTSYHLITRTFWIRCLQICFGIHCCPFWKCPISGNVCEFD